MSFEWVEVEPLVQTPTLAEGGYRAGGKKQTHLFCHRTKMGPVGIGEGRGLGGLVCCVLPLSSLPVEFYFT
jgi:hypothetical protein